VEEDDFPVGVDLGPQKTRELPPGDGCPQENGVGY
jgi:hypothetical protein